MIPWFPNTLKININKKLSYKQEAMENFVFPDEIKTKLMNLMKMINLMNIVHALKLCESAAVTATRSHGSN